MKQIGKKAQITAFIIIGLLILIIAGFGIYYFTSSKDVFEADTIENIPTITHPIFNFVNACLKETSTKAVKKLGEHGGYIDMTNPEPLDRTFSIDTNNPTESDAASFSQLSQPIPYFWYLESENNCLDCILNSQQPRIDEMQLQLNHYIESNLKNCLNNFNSFKQQDIFITNQDPKINSIISQTDITINLEMPILIKKEDVEATLEKFTQTINVDLNRLFELANEITFFLAEEQPIEELTNDLISFYSGLNFNKLPPISAIDHSPTTVEWQKDLVELNLKNMFTQYIQGIQIEKTLNTERIISDIPLEQLLFDKMYFFFLEKEYPLEVNFYYLDWPIYFDISPRSGNKLKPSSNTKKFDYGIDSPQITHYYEFFYDISYPIIIEIRDPSALNNQGYSLFFAYEANIRDNIDLLKWHLGEGTIGPLQQGNINLNDSQKVRSTRKLFCNDQQKLSGNISFEVSYNNEPIENAFIAYGCGNYKDCSLSSTNDEGKSIDSIPLCKGGFFLIEAKGYAPKKIPYDATLNKKDKINVNLQKLKEMNVEIIKYIMTDQTTIDPTPVALDEKDQVVISINKAIEDVLETEFSEHVQHPGTKNTINIVPGIYEITAQLLGEGFTIKKGCKVQCDPDKIKEDCGITPFGGCDTKCEGYIPSPDEDYPIGTSGTKQTIRGGVLLNTETQTWTVSQAEIDSNEKITFYILQTPKPTCVDEANNEDLFEHCCVDIDGNVDPCCLAPVKDDVKSNKCPSIPNPKCIPINEVSKTQQYSNQHKNILLPTFS